MSVHEHRSSAPDGPASIQVVVVSSTRTLDDDESGKLIESLVRAAGHTVTGRQIVPDDRGQIQSAVKAHARSGLVDVVILTGGTGISARDVTPGAIRELLDVEIEGFGELFRMISHAEIGAAAMLSRAMAGLVRSTGGGDTLIFAVPGSTNAARTAVSCRCVVIRTSRGSARSA